MSGHLKTTVTLEAVGKVDVSTIDLSTHGWPGATGIETCIFWTHRDGTEASEVVATYPNWTEAVKAHDEYTNPAVLAKVIMYYSRWHDFIQSAGQNGCEKCGS